MQTPGGSRMRFLAIGECMAELAPLDTQGDFRLGFAGDTFNTAWYLRQLRSEAQVAYFTALGSDDISDRMLGFMAGAGIDTAHIARCPERSVGMYLISLKDGERSFSYWRDTSAARLLADDETALAEAVRGAELIYFSGITLAILSDAARGRFLRALKSARAQGKTIAFDPNLRPRLWPDQGQMIAAIMQGAEVSDMALPSFEDEAAHFGDADPQATADRYLRAGASTVIVKNGAEPVHFIHQGVKGVVPVARIGRAVDTTSAGDSFNAGYLATLDAALPMESRITLASAVAGQVIAAKGALVPLDRAQLPHWPIPGSAKK